MNNYYDGNDDATREFNPDQDYAAPQYQGYAQQPNGNPQQGYPQQGYAQPVESDEDVEREIVSGLREMGRALPKYPLQTRHRDAYLERANNSLNPEHIQSLRDAVFTDEAEEEYTDRERDVRVAVTKYIRRVEAGRVADAREKETLEKNHEVLHNDYNLLQGDYDRAEEEREENQKKFTYTAIGAGALAIALIGSLWWGATKDSIPEDPNDAQQAVVQMQDENNRLQDELANKDKEIQQANQRADDALKKSDNPEAAKTVDKLNRDIQDRDRTIDQLKGDNDRAVKDNDRLQDRVDSLERELRDAQRNTSAPTTVTETVQAPAPAGGGNSGGNSTLDNLNPLN